MHGRCISGIGSISRVSQTDTLLQSWSVSTSHLHLRNGGKRRKSRITATCFSSNPEALLKGVGRHNCKGHLVPRCTSSWWKDIAAPGPERYPLILPEECTYLFRLVYICELISDVTFSFGSHCFELSKCPSLF